MRTTFLGILITLEGRITTRKGAKIRPRYSSEVVRTSLQPAHHNRSDKENQMKTLRQLSVASVFVFALAIPAFAGEIQIPLAPPPQSAQSATAQGEIQTTVTGQDGTGSSEATAADSATGAALNLLQSVLSLF